jgi:hypothetical protein
MQTVGQLDQQGTHIIVDRGQHLMEVVDLLGVVVLLLLLLGHCSHKKGHIVTEALADVLDSVVSVLDNVVE